MVSEILRTSPQNSEDLPIRTDEYSLMVRSSDQGSVEQITGEIPMKGFSGSIDFKAEFKQDTQSIGWFGRQWKKLDNIVGINPNFVSRVRDELEI